MGNMKETHNVFLKFSFQKHPLCSFVFLWEKPFRNHKTCLEMGFSGGNTTQCQQCMLAVFVTCFGVECNDRENVGALLSIKIFREHLSWRLTLSNYDTNHDAGSWDYYNAIIINLKWP